MAAYQLGSVSALRTVVGTGDKAVWMVVTMAYFLLGKNWPALAYVTMWWDGPGARVHRDAGDAGGALPDIEGPSDIETFLAGVEVGVGNCVVTTPADGDVETGVEATTGVETSMGNDDDTIAGVNAGGETSVGVVMEAG
jgi:hypothetical protein